MSGRGSSESVAASAVTTLSPRVLAIAALVLVAGLVVSGLRPFDRMTWALEVFPVVLVLPLLGLTRERYPLTALLYACIFVHAWVLIVGGTYTYARVPLGFWVQDLWALDRNPYDKLGHFLQGFVPALAAREVIVRGAHVRGPRMRTFLLLSIALAISAAYELLEWAAALALGADADAFLGTQGDPWDTQSDMFVALLGATCALVLLSRWHDGQMRPTKP